MDVTHFIKSFMSLVVTNTLIFLYIYKQLGSTLNPQSCLYFQGFDIFKLLIVAELFHQETYVYEEYSNFQDSKSMFMVSDFKILPKMLSRHLNFGAL